MSFLKALFGPSQEEIWRQVANEVGGRFHEGGWMAQSAVQARTDDWIITLDTYTQSTGNVHTTYTRLRAPYFNPEGFRFEIYRTGPFTGLGKALGMEDIEVGHKRFDDDFVIKSTRPRRVRRLFDNRKIRHLIDAQPRIHLSVKGHEGLFSRFPAGVDELHFQAQGTMKDLAQLRQLFDLFSEVLQQVCHEGQAYEDDVRIHSRRLRAPGGRIEDTHTIWEGDQPRRDAAAALGRIGDPAAVRPLARVLRDDDRALRAEAIEALGRIGHAGAIGPLIRLLGDNDRVEGRRICDRAADALRELGEEELVDALASALGGDFAPLKARGSDYRAEIIEALGEAVEGPWGVDAASALAEINAVEALPGLREIRRRVGRRQTLGAAVSGAIQRLEARASLPRAAAAADVEVDTLPRPAREPGPDRETLPRGSRAPPE